MLDGVDEDAHMHEHTLTNILKMGFQHIPLNNKIELVPHDNEPIVLSPTSASPAQSMHCIAG